MALHLALLPLFALALASAAPAQDAPRRANVIHVMADELGYYELSCLGNPNLRTPNLDRMAAEGMRFTQCLAGSAVCAPTRACLMTGKHSGHTSVRTNGGGTPLRADEATVASMLKSASYATGGFGKWGCGGRGSTGVPELHGFDTFVGYYDQVHAHSYYPPYILENSRELVLEGNDGGRAGATYSHAVIMERARQFIRAHKDEPFFCYMPVTPPHGMFDLPENDPAWAEFKDAPWPIEARRYAAMVAMLDREVGELFALLDALGLTENTLVLFSGDNGGADYFASQEHPRGIHGANVDPRTGVEFRGKKGELFEGGLRVPMIARWPGRIAPGTVTDHLCYFPDFLPTIADVTGATPPSDIDGVSFAPTLFGGEQPEHGHLYWEIGGWTAVRAGDWKLVRTKAKEPWLLFDLATDVSEAHDVASEHPDVVERLAALAARSHEPAREGTFADRTLHERDRAAKWGSAGPPAKPAPAANTTQSDRAAWPRGDLLPTKDWRVVRVSSESSSNGKVARNAFDGDPSTLWHSNWQGTAAKHPHELVLDLGGSVTVRGVRYLARQDGGWNGALAACELTIGDDPDAFPAPQITTTFKKSKDAQTVTCEPVRGRYLRVRALSEVNGGPWASIAELGVLGG
ncbi:MAG: sulfatase-like hydrolase/transferase [Planctomycetota bacterium]